MLRRLCVAAACAAALATPAVASATSLNAFELVARIDPPPGRMNSDRAPEIVDVTPDGNLLVTTLGVRGIGFVDITDPAHPLYQAEIPSGNEDRATSVAITKDGKYVLAAFRNGPTLADYLLVIDLTTRQTVHRIDLPEGPDGMAISPDGAYAVIAIENEFPPSVSGSIAILPLDGPDPTQWVLKNVPIPPDPDMLAATDAQHEFVDVNRSNVAAVTLQENNAVAIVDLESATLTDV